MSSLPELRTEDVQNLDLIKETVFSKLYYGKMGKVKVSVTKIVQLDTVDVQAEARNLVAKELQQIKNMEHPRLLEYFGVIYEPTAISIVSKFMEKGTLLDRIRLKESFKLIQMHLAAHDICAAMMYLDKVGFVYKNFGSYSVFLDDYSRIKIGGLVSYGSDYCRGTNLVAARYSGPEKFDDNFGDDDKETVLYSLGIVLWEISSSRFCFENVIDYKELQGIKQSSRCAPELASDPMDISKYIEMLTDTDNKKRTGLSELLFYLGGKLQGDFPTTESKLKESTFQVEPTKYGPTISVNTLSSAVEEKKRDFGRRNVVVDRTISAKQSFPSMTPLEAFDQVESPTAKPGLTLISDNAVVAVLESFSY